MTDTTAESTAAGERVETPGPARSWVRANLHFLVAAGILAAATVAWYSVIQAKGWWPLKKPVPWPQGVQISENSRWLNLAKEFGHYRVAREAEMGKPRDRQDPWEIVYDSSVLSSLNIATNLSEAQLKARSSNWYVSRYYVDSRAIESGLAGSPYARWHLDVTYYTGGIDLVPHTPEACLNAGGRQVTDSSPVEFQISVPDTWKRSWNARTKPFLDKKTGVKENRPVITFQRVESVHPATRSRSVDYYIFCLNGEPETSRLEVRRKLTYPWVRHCYFAKVQFAPKTESSIENLEEADKAAEEFIRYALPEVLKAMPTPDDVQRLSSGG